MWSSSIAVCALDEAAEPRAKMIAAQLKLPYATDESHCSMALLVSNTLCTLRRMTSPSIDWSIDFLSSAYRQKRAMRTRKNDALSRAVGLHKKPQLRVLDMSAGLGKDAYWIAHCGATVTLIERHPVLAFLLQEAILALRADLIEGPIGERMSVVHTDAALYLSSLEPGQFDVAYYDPMFLPRKKSALVKKDMQIMQDLLGEDKINDLTESVLSCIPRLVVKRAKSDPPYNKLFHVATETGTTRYEVYQKIV